MLTHIARPDRLQRRITRQAGVTLIELMIGLAVGLIVIAGGLFLLSTLTQDNRRLLVETRLNQDLRAASDLIARDLRRAGYWAGAASGVYVPGVGGAQPSNAYSNFIPGPCSDTTLQAAAVPTPSAASTSICYYIEQGTPDNLRSDSELFGFALVNGVLNAFVAGTTALPLTDPESLVIDSFQITPRSANFDMTSSCIGAASGTGPQVVVRRFDIQLRGYAPSDPTLIRGLTTTVRVRNDAITGSCP